jgi:D-glycero-D-manno-heptose 1,7-bisphosphate phosphatase
MNRLLCFDLDGTLIEGHVRPKEGGGFEEIRPFSEVIPLPNVKARLANVVDSGAHIAICTNKAGVGFGHHTPTDCYEKAVKVLETLELPCLMSRELSWHEAYGHPHASLEQYRGDDPERKPNPGMLLAAMARHGAEPATTTMIGDMEVDEEAAIRAGCAFIHASRYFGWPD